MSNRINIDGIWYVREDSIAKPDPADDILNDITWFDGAIYENDEYAFEITRIRASEEGSYYPGIDIKFTDKRGDKEYWIEEYWDNPAWFKCVIQNDPNAFREVSIHGDGIRILKALLKKMVDKEWLILD